MPAEFRRQFRQFGKSAFFQMRPFSGERKAVSRPQKRFVVAVDAEKFQFGVPFEQHSAVTAAPDGAVDKAFQRTRSFRKNGDRLFCENGDVGEFGGVHHLPSGSSLSKIS